MLSERMCSARAEADAVAMQKEQERVESERQKAEAAESRAKKNELKSFVKEALGSLFKTTKRQVTTRIGREITRTILGTFFGKL